MSAFLHGVLRARGRVFLLLVGLPLLMAVVLLPSGTASAATAPVSKCNSVLNIAGQSIRCDVTVANTLDAATGVGSSSVTVHVCTGAAGAPTCAAPVTTNNADVVTSVSQCNSSGNGGGGEITCTVDVTNDVTGGATPTAATVNECVGSAGGGGTMSCSPVSSTTGATVTQCNGSGNGGGSTVTCSVAPASTQSASLPVTVKQCNGSDSGGGSQVTCRTSITNRVTAAAVASPTPSPTASASATVSPSTTPSPSATPSASATAAGSPSAVATPTTAPSATPTPATPTQPATETGGGTAPGTPTGPVAPVGGPVGPTGTTTTNTTATTSLPRTGTDTGLASVLACLSIALGAGMLLAGRQPRGRHSAH